MNYGKRPIPSYIYIAAVIAVVIMVLPAAGDDWEYWCESRANANLIPKLKLGVEQKFRFRNDMSDYYFEQTNVGIWWEAHKFLELGTFYGHTEQQSVSGIWRSEERWTLEATLKAKLGPFVFKDRNRFEERWLEVGGEQQRYRNSFRVEFPRKVHAWTITPFVYDELFYDFVAGEMNRNRLAVGVAATISKNLLVEVYYILQDDKAGGDWQGRNVLASQIKLTF